MLTVDWLLILSSWLVPFVPLFFQGGCACCCVMCSTNAPICSDSWTTATIEIAGWSTGPLGCSDCASTLNGTFIYSVSDNATNCGAGGSTPLSCFGGITAGTGIVISRTFSGLHVNQNIDSGGGFPQDACWAGSTLVVGPTGCVPCLGTYTLEAAPDGGLPGACSYNMNPGTYCTHDLSDVTVTLS